MTVSATPTITVAGATVPIGDVGGVRPSLVAVLDLSVTWGRSGVLDQPTPARARVSLLDTAPGRPFASRRDLIGQLVVLGWSSAAASGTTFRGRITDVTIERYESPAGSVVGSVVTLDASSIEVDLANYVLPPSVWPAETFTARLARIMGLLPSGLIASAEFHPTWASSTAAQIDVTDKDLLSMLRTMWDSAARPLVYDPAANALTYGRRRFVAAGAAGGDVLHSAQLALSGGTWAATCSPMGGSWLDAVRFAYEGALTSAQSAKLTRVAVSYYDSAASWAQTTYRLALTTTPGEDVIGRRTLSVESVHSTADNAAACANEWASLAQAEAAIPGIEPVTFATARTPFADTAEAALLLAGAESQLWYFLRRSWRPEVGVTPMVGIIGGAIRYSGGEWTIAPQFAPAYNQNMPPGLVSAYAATSDAVLLRDLDESVTFGDCAHISVGAGYTPATMPWIG